jgi:glycosyltransferase involved in cell wall biosynthesis
MLSESIREVIENRHLKERLVEAALVRVKQYSWPRIARKVLSLYQSLES